MTEIKEIKKGDFWFHLDSGEFLDEKTGNDLLIKTRSIMHEKHTITIDLNKIRIINSKGYNYLIKLMHEANSKQTSIYFTNVHPDIDELITSLTFTSD